MNTYILDTECYPNYWLFSAVNHKNGATLEIELTHENQKLNADDRAKIYRLLRNHETVSFNGLNYDIPMIEAACKGWTAENLNKLSTKLITDKRALWQITKEHNLFVETYDNHIDIIELLIGQASLKIYGGRIHTKKMQDLPIEPHHLIKEQEHPLLREYCRNDIQVTAELFDKLSGQIDLRKSMSVKYGINLKSKSDAQIAEALIKSELSHETGRTYKPKFYPPHYEFNYRIPPFIIFESPHLQEVLSKIESELFRIKDNGSVEIPLWLSKPIKINERSYQMGIGGLHSCEKGQHIKAADNNYLSDFDVSSYYPSIILGQNLYPESMGKPFLDLYRKIVKERIAAKNTNDKVTADTYKILLNGSFGKFGSKYSSLYSPELLLQTTLTGQLSLLMLIEKLEASGIQVMSANTDGIVTYYHESQTELLKEILFDWEIATSYNLEQTNYRELASRDVNNYVAVKMDGKTKCKGCFGEASLSKNPDGLIIYEAVASYIATKRPIEDTILQCADITKFITVRRVTGGAIWLNAPIGKAIRFYHSSDAVIAGESIHYAKNNNRVPMSQGCRPIMNLPDTFPSDVDFNYYIDKSKETLKLVGIHA